MIHYLPFQSGSLKPGAQGNLLVRGIKQQTFILDVRQGKLNCNERSLGAAINLVHFHFTTSPFNKSIFLNDINDI